MRFGDWMKQTNRPPAIFTGGLHSEEAILRRAGIAPAIDK